MGTAEETWNNQRACYAINLHLGDIPVRCSVLHTAEEYFFTFKKYPSFENVHKYYEQK